MYIADANNGRIRKITASTGVISTIAGSGASSHSGDGGPATLATIYYPQGIALDSSGNVYIAETDYNYIRKITVSTGIITTIAGTGLGTYDGDGQQASSSALSSPNGVALDSSGR